MINKLCFSLAFAFSFLNFRRFMRHLIILPVLGFFLAGCGEKKTSQKKIVQDSAFAGKGSFAYDLAFLQKHESVIVLGEASSKAKVLIINNYQARVMTSTARGDEGESFGWINYGLIESGVRKHHINPVGGEDRFWIGPEGGQNSLFFKKGKSFTFENWQTPGLIDSGAFDLVSVSTSQAVFKKAGTVVNYKGFTFKFDITRSINLLSDADIRMVFGISTENISSVAYQSTNFITNTGNSEWTKKNGLLSIWILGMFIPSDRTTIAIPHKTSPVAENKITDDYFGKIPADRILKRDDILMLKGDGRFRCKTGIPPSIAKNIAGSYDAEKHILTLVKFDMDETGDYVNSKWENQKEPFRGDVVNAYNDGPLPEGNQLGPFYELESSSAAKELKPRKSMTHRHITLHLEGDENLLSNIARHSLGVSLAEITNAFEKQEGKK
jgi:hypothetical protein